MALFIFRRNSHSPGRSPQHAGHGHIDPPQRMCLHPAHNGIPVPTKFTGTSLLDGVVIYHFRCVLNPAHHRQFIRAGNQWQEVKIQ